MQHSGNVSQVYHSTRELIVRVKDEKQLTIVYLEGYLAQLEVYKFKRHIDDLLQRGSRLMLLDLSKVTFIDSAGIGALCQADNECRRVGGHASYVHSKQVAVRRSLEVAGLQKKLAIHEDLPDAMISLASDYGIPIPAHLTRSDATPMPAPGASAEGAPGSAAAAAPGAMDEVLKRLDEMEKRLAAIERRISGL